MPIYPDDRVLVAVMNNYTDWQRVLAEKWYRIPVKHAPPGAPHFDWLAFYFTRVFESDKWAIHYYAPICGHELVTRRDLLPEEPDHKRAGQWYYKLEIGQLQHKIPPITARTWKRITFIVTTGDRFELASEIEHLFADKDATGSSYITIKEDTLATW
jgi:hypothetical protein